MASTSAAVNFIISQITSSDVPTSCKALRQVGDVCVCVCVCVCRVEEEVWSSILAVLSLLVHNRVVAVIWFACLSIVLFFIEKTLKQKSREGLG